MSGYSDLFQILASQLEETAGKSDAFGRSQPLGQLQKLGGIGLLPLKISMARCLSILMRHSRT